MEHRKTSDFIDRLIHLEGIDFPELVLRPDSLECELGNSKIELPAAEFAVLWMLAIRCKNSLPPIKGIPSLLEEFKAFTDSISSSVMPGINNSARFPGRPGSSRAGADFTEKELMKVVESLSEKIKSAVTSKQGLDYMIPEKGNSSFSIIMPASKIFCPRNY
ncbi:MAG TPA: hypothetical protein DCZ94_22375 [Lentisphaeria bacterium]|nr:MAG: hypothetical protein A2X48_13615 [Lentisphaerae bacterium GWF2_49_21]HBC89695.1 hypothetical protein [Lentisphaeria bacterium]